MRPFSRQIIAAHFTLLATLVFLATLGLTTPMQLQAADPPGYLMPWTGSEDHYMTQGWNTGSHTTTNSFYAYDFDLYLQPVRASRAGTVRWVKSSETGCSLDFRSTGNGVVIDHDDGSATLYMHLASNGVFVSTGQRVHQGAVIGLSGNTGYVLPCPGGYHLHFNRQIQGGQPWTTSQPVYFEELPYTQNPPTQQLNTTTLYRSRNQEYAVLYWDAPLPTTYSGSSLHLRPQHDVSNLGSYGWDNQASAIHVPEGVAVTLYENPNYGGANQTFTAMDKTLVGESPIGNDVASSLKYQGVWLFENINYNPEYYARAEFFTNHDNLLVGNYIGNDAASSFCAPPGWAMGLFEHQDYNGQARFLTDCGNLTDLAMQNPAAPQDPLSSITWNDQASAVGVYPNTPLLNEPPLSFSSGWTPSSPWPKAIGNSVSFTCNGGATTSYTFTGTGVTYIFTMASNRGIAKVEVFNAGNVLESSSLVNLNNANVYWQRWHSVIGLPWGTHTLKITAYSTSCAGSATYIDIDGLLIHP